MSGTFVQAQALANFGKTERGIAFTQHLQNGDRAIQTVQLVEIAGLGQSFRNWESG
jgi:hypothetical protein